jgi:hypothetical protein
MEKGIIYHKGLEQCAVEMLPKKLQNLYLEELKESGLSNQELYLEKDCSCSFSWDNSVNGRTFWTNVYNGKWSEEFDEDISIDEIINTVKTLINKVIC